MIGEKIYVKKICVSAGGSIMTKPLFTDTKPNRLPSTPPLPSAS